MENSPGLLPHINAKLESEKIAAFIKTAFAGRGFSKAVIAVSGGVDSAISFVLTARALGKKHLFPLLLPYGSLNQQGTADAKKLITAAGIQKSQIEVIDISTTVNAMLKILDLNQKLTSDRVRTGNIMARCRMVAIYDRAKKHEALVVGTENKSEDLLSYFTRFGDEASDIEPIKHLYKTQVYEMARYLKIPGTILTKAPTAGLWSGQTDENDFGFSYRLADSILHGLYDLNLSKRQLINQGFDENDVQRVKEWVDKNHFKHELPLGIKSPDPVKITCDSS